MQLFKELQCFSSCSWTFYGVKSSLLFFKNLARPFRLFSIGQLENLLERNFCYIKWDTISFCKISTCSPAMIVCISCSYCANNACICCCIISCCWICWLIADLNFLLIQVFLNSALCFVFQFTFISSNYFTCLFEIFHGNIVSIKAFLSLQAQRVKFL